MPAEIVKLTTATGRKWGGYSMLRQSIENRSMIIQHPEVVLRATGIRRIGNQDCRVWTAHHTQLRACRMGHSCRPARGLRNHGACQRPCCRRRSARGALGRRAGHPDHALPAGLGTVAGWRASRAQSGDVQLRRGGGRPLERPHHRHTPHGYRRPRGGPAGLPRGSAAQSLRRPALRLRQVIATAGQLPAMPLAARGHALGGYLPDLLPRCSARCSSEEM